LHGPASIMYERAVELSVENTAVPPPLDTTTRVLKESSSPPSENLLTSLTALATFQARSGDVSSALPILVSILNARKSLPSPSTRPTRRSGRRRPSAATVSPPAWRTGRAWWRGWRGRNGPGSNGRTWRRKEEEEEEEAPGSASGARARETCGPRTSIAGPLRR